MGEGGGLGPVAEQVVKGGAMGSAREEARQWVRRKGRFYGVLVVYVVLSVLWVTIDLVTGGDLWFYWPMLGFGVVVAVIDLIMFGVGSLFGADWERRQVDRYVERRGGGDDENT
jgi:hypothetical protein